MRKQDLVDTYKKIREALKDDLSLSCLHYMYNSALDRMDDQNTLPYLYYNYKKVSDDKIREYLERIVVVKHIGRGFYPLSKRAMDKIKKKPRNISLTFDATSTNRTRVKGLHIWKEVTYLVKSSSRFFLKPDIGEIFDAIPWQDLLTDTIKGIEFINEYETIPYTDGEHFLMKANLLTDDVSLAIKDLK